MKPRSYWHALVNTFSSFRYYLDVMRAPLWFSTRFFIISMIAIGWLFAARLQKQVFPQLHQQLETIQNETVSHYPQDRIVEWNGETLTTTPTEPFVISYPSFIQSQRENVSLPEHLAVILPDNPNEDPASLNTHRSFMVAGPTSLFISDLQGAWQKTDLPSLMGQTTWRVTSDTVSEQIGAVMNGIKGVLQLGKWLFVLVMPLLLVIHGLWMSLLESLLAFFLFRVNRLNLPFTKVFQLSLHLVVIAEAINQLTLWLYPMQNVPMFSLAYWLVLLGIFWTQRAALAREYP